MQGQKERTGGGCSGVKNKRFIVAERRVNEFQRKKNHERKENRKCRVLLAGQPEASDQENKNCRRRNDIRLVSCLKENQIHVCTS